MLHLINHVISERSRQCNITAVFTELTYLYHCFGPSAQQLWSLVPVCQSSCQMSTMSYSSPKSWQFSVLLGCQLSHTKRKNMHTHHYCEVKLCRELSPRYTSQGVALAVTSCEACVLMRGQLQKNNWNSVHTSESAISVLRRWTSLKWWPCWEGVVSYS